MSGVRCQEIGASPTFADYATTFRMLNVGQVFRIYKKGETVLRQKISTRSYVDFTDGPNGTRKTIDASTPVVQVQP